MRLSGQVIKEWFRERPLLQILHVQEVQRLYISGRMQAHRRHPIKETLPTYKAHPNMPRLLHGQLKRVLQQVQHPQPSRLIQPAQEVRS